MKGGLKAGRKAAVLVDKLVGWRALMLAVMLVVSLADALVTKMVETLAACSVLKLAAKWVA